MRSGRSKPPIGRSGKRERCTSPRRGQTCLVAATIATVVKFMMLSLLVVQLFLSLQLLPLLLLMLLLPLPFFIPMVDVVLLQLLSYMLLHAPASAIVVAAPMTFDFAVAAAAAALSDGI